MTSHVSTSRPGERGSALLIVFLFAAVLAISLYMEMPSYAFEAKRIKEQLLVDRGNEYAHAVKLYYRKFRSYPPSIDALESTNQLRFLRHKFKDPMTGEANWRLLHAGPGGILIDSKVNPIGLNANGQNSGTNSGNSINSNSSTASASSAFGFASSSAPVAQVPNNGQPAAAVLPQRPPEMPINGGAAFTSAVNSGDPTQSLLTTSPVQDAGSLNSPGQTPQPAMPGAQAPLGPVSQQPVPFVPGALPPNGQSPNQGVQSLINNPNPLTPNSNAPGAAPLTSSAGGSGSGASTGSISSGAGVLGSGSIAGVASIAKGASIKTVNDQSDYFLWEFYYDPTKDTSATAQGSGTAGSGVNPLNGLNPQNNNSLTPNSSNSFGSSTPQPSNQPVPTAPTPLTPQPQQP